MLESVVAQMRWKYNSSSLMPSLYRKLAWKPLCPLRLSYSSKINYLELKQSSFLLLTTLNLIATTLHLQTKPNKSSYWEMFNIHVLGPLVTFVTVFLFRFAFKTSCMDTDLYHRNVYNIRCWWPPWQLTHISDGNLHIW